MNDLTSITFAGRCFSPDEVALIRQAAADYSELGMTEIARTICEWLDWKRPSGRLKNHECRLLLERLRDPQSVGKVSETAELGPGAAKFGKTWVRGQLPVGF